MRAKNKGTKPGNPALFRPVIVQSAAVLDAIVTAGVNPRKNDGDIRRPQKRIGLGCPYNFQGFCLVQNALSGKATANEAVLARFIGGALFGRCSLLSDVDEVDELYPGERNQMPVFCNGRKTVRTMALKRWQAWPLLRRR